MSNLNHDDLIYDWNTAGTVPPRPTAIQFDDETLRDGLQSPSARNPELSDKIRLIHLMDQLGIQTADVGLPGAGDQARHHIAKLVKEMKGLKIKANVACRTLVSDIAPVVDIAQATGEPIEVCAFIGSSPIRQFAEGWEMEKMLGLVRDSVSFAVKNGLPCMFVTEDTTRAKPEDVRALYSTAIEAGATRICVCDTCGHVTPDGVRALIGFVKEIVAESGADVGIDWHGHRDRGLGLINSLAALRAGASRVHACALGVGERAGNTEMDLLLVNLRLLGWIDNDLTHLGEYVKLAHKVIGVPLPSNYSVFGSDAFETGTGVHAAAVIKAFKKGDHWLANRVYSGVPADMVGLEQVIKIGPMSGKSNVIWYLEKRGIAATDKAVDAVLAVAKNAKGLLRDEEILAAARS
ncbi:MAG: 2-isopropylmalate synthase [Planctomycetes bacterium]|nr:2-isopropylmalate synthase [Planctomycetota bacterium]